MKKKRKDNRGMTLVETVVAFALIAVVSLFAVSGFMTAAALIRRGLDIQSAGDAAAASLEDAWDDRGTDAQLRFYTADGAYVGAVDGRVVTQQQTVNDNEAALSAFAAD